MAIVIIGANANVAQAARTLATDRIHVQLPGASDLDGTCDESDLVLHVDYREPAEFLAFTEEVLRPLSPQAVVSLTEPGLEPAAVAAEVLGIHGVPQSVVRTTRNKLSMRRALAGKAPHLNPAFASGGDPVAVKQLFAGHSPVVAKPVDGVGSRAVMLVDTRADLPGDRQTGGTILEEFVGGLEFSVEALSLNGSHTIVGIAQKGTTTGFVELSHVMPPPALDRRRHALVEQAVAELLDAVGLADGPSHTEVKVNGDRVTVIETHNRLGGDGIADLVRLTTGVDWRRAALGWPIGAGIRRESPAAPAAATVFFTARPGRVTAVARRPVLTHGTIIDWQVSARVGDLVSPLRSSLDRLGFATLTAHSATECAEAVSELTALDIVTTEHVP